MGERIKPSGVLVPINHRTRWKKMGTAGSKPAGDWTKFLGQAASILRFFCKVWIVYPEKVSKVGDFLNQKMIFSHLTCGIILTFAHLKYAKVRQPFTEGMMLKGTRVLMGDEARLYNKVINTLRGLVHRG